MGTPRDMLDKYRNKGINNRCPKCMVMSEGPMYKCQKTGMFGSESCTREIWLECPLNNVEPNLNIKGPEFDTVLGLGKPWKPGGK